MLHHFFRCAILASLLCLLVISASCQPSAPIELRYLQAEQMPRLPDGAGSAASIEAALRARLRYQPPAGRPAFTATDKVLLSFTIGADGRVREARVLSQLEPGFGRAVLAAAAQLPRFTPGRQQDQAVAVRYTLPIGAAGPYVGNSTNERGPVTLPPVWPEVEKYPMAPPRLPGNVSLRTALAQRLVYPPAGTRSPYGDAPLVGLAFTVDAEGHPTDVLIESSGGLSYDRAAVAALAALPPFEPYKGAKGPTATRLRVDVSFPPRPAGHQPAISSQLPADPPVDSPAIIDLLNAQQPPAAERGGRQFLAAVVQHFALMPEEVRRGQVDGLVVVEAVAGLSGRVYGLRIRQSLSAACDSAALAAVRQLPLLTPGQYRGQTVAIRFTLPVRFWGPTHLYEPYSAPHPATFTSPDLETYVRTNLRVSDSLRKAPKARSVDVLVVITADGQVQQATLTRPSFAQIDQEALRFARAMPRWQPARDAQDQAVASQVPLTLRFPPLPAEGTAPSAPPSPPPASPANPPVSERVVEKVEADPVYTYVEQMPELPGGGGPEAIKAALQARFRYPAEAVGEQTQGIIRVRFVVGTDGQVREGSVVKGLSAATDRAALVAVKALPHFVPGKQSGRLVSVFYTVNVAVAPPAR